MAVASNTITDTTKFGEWIDLLNIVINEARSVSNTIPDALITKEAVLNDPDLRTVLGIGANDSPVFDNQPLTQNSYVYLSSLDQDVSSGSNVKFVDVKSTNTHVGTIEPYGFSVDGKVQLGANDYIYENGFSVGDTNFDQNGDGSFTVLAINTDTVGGYALSVNGSINTSANTYENEVRVYSPNNIDADSVGLNNVLNSEQVPKSGGEFTGNVTVQDDFIADSILVNMDGTTYELVSEGFLLNRGNYYGVSYDMSSIDSSPQGVAFSPNGLRMFVLGNINNKVYQFTLSESYMVDSASYDNVSFDLANEAWFGFTFGNSGSKMYVLSLNDDTIHQYSLSTPWDLSTISYDNISLQITDDTIPIELRFNSNGTKMFIAGASGNQILEYSLSTAWNVSTATYSLVFYALGYQPNGLAFNSNGSKLFIVGDVTIGVRQYNLSTPFDLSTISYDNISFDISDHSVTSNHLTFDINGNRMYVSNALTDLIYQFSTNELRLIQQ